jgi:hypothetical protein
MDLTRTLEGIRHSIKLLEEGTVATVWRFGRSRFNEEVQVPLVDSGPESVSAHLEELR